MSCFAWVVAVWHLCLAFSGGSWRGVGSKVTVGLLELPSQALLPGEGRAAGAHLWGPLWLLSCGSCPAWGYVAS